MSERRSRVFLVDDHHLFRSGVRAELGDTVVDVVVKVERILTAARGVEATLAGLGGAALEPALTDVRAQLDGLVYRGFVTASGWERLPDVLRYLRAIERRLEKLQADPLRDRRRMRPIEDVQDAYQERLDALPPGRPPDPALRRVRWMIEELRVNAFAQALGTPYPISEERVYRALDQAGR